jgi:uncharacterized protein (TIGR02996 family)
MTEADWLDACADHLRRLAFADWLQERGDHYRVRVLSLTVYFLPRLLYSFTQPWAMTGSLAATSLPNRTSST